MINLTSDNWSGAHPKISEALLRHCDGGATAYGASVLDKKIERTFNEIFESDVAVYFVGTGTAANALSMAYLNRAGGIIFAHRHAHLIEDECGAPEYFTGGARLVGVGGAEGRIDPEPDVKGSSGWHVSAAIEENTFSRRIYAYKQLERAGINLITSECAILGLVGDSAHPQFRAVQKLIRESAPDTGLISHTSLV
uniref:Beta_elim_lyase domain-containing protein n=1 Tax=Globodera pallida TaxID=36090 RepID=A0A183C2T8_GLOPA